MSQHPDPKHASRADADTGAAAERRRARMRVSRLGLAVVAVGALVQLLLGTYYLAMAHSPEPHRLPVGVVGTTQQTAPITEQLEAEGQFAVTSYDDADDLTAAIEGREAYGGIAFDGETPTLQVATAASPSVANLLRGQFTTSYQDQVATQVQAAVSSGRPVDAATLTALTTPPQIVDVVPLPDDDSAGSSLGFVIQAICLGGSIASLALGRLGRLTQRSALRGVGHAALLGVYALLSAGVAMLALHVFGIGTDADRLELFGGFALISLAVTASTAAVVALVGPLGSLLGALYFTLGLVISGSSIAPEMLPETGRGIGQLLPPGAGATVVRDALYFPAATDTRAVTVLVVFSTVGLLVVLVTNAAANRTRRTSTVRLGSAA